VRHFSIFVTQKQRTFLVVMKTNVYTKGNIESGAVIFIHGNSLNGESFRKQFDTINDTPLVAIDLPGHGLSQKAENPEAVYCLPGYVDAIKQLVSEFKLHDYIIVGHSLGGHIAIEAADELTGLKGIILFGTPPLGIPPDMANAFLPNPAMGLLFQKDLSDEEIDLLCNSLADPSHIELYPNLAAQLKASDGNSRTYLLHSIGAGKQKNELEIVSRLNIPVAIFHGANDPIINLEYLKNMNCPTLWENTIHIIKDSGHSPQMEKTEDFNLLLKRFYDFVFSVK